MNETIQLKPHQKKIVEMNPTTALIPDSTGTGKTLIGIMLADKNCDTCLVVTIKDNVAKWEREIEQFSSRECRFLVLSKENFRKDHRTIGKYDGVIIDECHYFAGMRSQMSKAFAWWLRVNEIKYRYLMSATPVTSNWQSVMVLAKHLGNNLNYYRFMRYFFYEISMGGRRVWKPNPNKEAALIELVRRLAHGRMVTMESIAKVPEQKFITEYFELTDEQKTGIEELLDPEHIVRWTKTHQIENGTLAGNEYEEAKRFRCLKNDRIHELAHETDKIAIFCRYNYQIETLVSLLRHLKKPIFVINGANTNRDQTVQEVEAAEECIVLINASCGTGYELPSIGTIVFASLSFSYLDYEQSKGRFLRINKLKENTYYHLVTKGGVDEAVFDCIQNKKDFYIEMFKSINK